jgi:hypothetical protein
LFAGFLLNASVCVPGHRAAVRWGMNRSSRPEVHCPKKARV